MRDLLFTNFKAKFLSLLAATFLWFSIRQATPPEATLVERDFPGLPIELKVSSEEPFSYKVEPWTVQVRLRGDPAVLQSLREDQIEIFVSLTDVKVDADGQRKRIQVRAPDGTRLISIDPEEVVVKRLPAPPLEPK